MNKYRIINKKFYNIRIKFNKSQINKFQKIRNFKIKLNNLNL